MFDDQIDNFENISEINTEEVISKLSQFSSIKLCDIIICNRYLGFNNEIAIASMEELSKRRINGDSFNFEDYIEKEYKSLPVIQSNLIDLKSALGQIINNIKK